MIQDAKARPEQFEKKSTKAVSAVPILEGLATNNASDGMGAYLLAFGEATIHDEDVCMRIHLALACGEGQSTQQT